MNVTGRFTLYDAEMNIYDAIRTDHTTVTSDGVTRFVGKLSDGTDIVFYDEFAFSPSNNKQYLVPENLQLYDIHGTPYNAIKTVLTKAGDGFNGDSSTNYFIGKIITSIGVFNIIFYPYYAYMPDRNMKFFLDNPLQHRVTDTYKPPSEELPVYNHITGDVKGYDVDPTTGKYTKRYGFKSDPVPETPPATKPATKTSVQNGFRVDPSVSEFGFGEGNSVAVSSKQDQYLRHAFDLPKEQKPTQDYGFGKSSQQHTPTTAEEQGFGYKPYDPNGFRFTDDPRLGVVNSPPPPGGNEPYDFFKYNGRTPHPGRGGKFKSIKSKQKLKSKKNKKSKKYV